MNDDTAIGRGPLTRLIWLYFLLLVAEGALRKWIVPGLSNALLIVRDPVALAIIYLSWRDGFLPRTALLRVLAALCVAFVGLAALQFSLGYVRSVPALVFGLRTYFLHLPLVFIMPRVLDQRSVRRLTIATLVIAAPIALLMVRQFQAPPNDWLNVGVGKGGLQIVSAMGKVRRAGPFSFITGPVWLFSLVCGCLIGSHLSRDHIPAVIRWAGWAALLVAAAVSGSRSLVIGLVPVVLASTIALFLQPAIAHRALRAAFTVGAAAMLVWSLGVVKEGVDVLNTRVESAGGMTELLRRSSDTYEFAQAAWVDAPVLGVGLGLGTNVGAALIGGATFQFGEGEWTRVIFEAGPVLGLAYLLWRFGLALLLLRHGSTSARLGHVLPLALAGASAANVLLGQWGQPTTQGFAVWVAGMSLAACHASETGHGMPEPGP